MSVIKQAAGAYKRWTYRGGRPQRWARIQNRVWAILHAAGLWPDRMATLDVAGRKSGRIISFPVAIAALDGERYLVSMLGEQAQWVLNVRAAAGHAVLRHGRRETVVLEEVPVERRPPVIKQYLAVAMGARPHIPVDRHAALEEFARIAADFPVFRITADPGPRAGDDLSTRTSSSGRTA